MSIQLERQRQSQRARCAGKHEGPAVSQQRRLPRPVHVAPSKKADRQHQNDRKAVVRQRISGPAQYPAEVLVRQGEKQALSVKKVEQDRGQVDAEIDRGNQREHENDRIAQRIVELLIGEWNAELPRCQRQTLLGAVLVEQIARDQSAEFPMDHLDLLMHRFRGRRQLKCLALFKRIHGEGNVAILLEQFVWREAWLAEERSIVAFIAALQDPPAQIAQLGPDAIDGSAVLSEITLRNRCRVVHNIIEACRRDFQRVLDFVDDLVTELRHANPALDQVPHPEQDVPVRFLLQEIEIQRPHADDDHQIRNVLLFDRVEDRLWQRYARHFGDLNDILVKQDEQKKDE